METEQDRVIRSLEKRLEKHDNSRKNVQGKLKELRDKLTEQINGLEDRINRELCEKFTSKEDRLQAALNELRGSSTISALQKAKAELRVIQSYEIIENNEPNNDLTALYELKIERRTITEDDSVGLTISEVDSSTNDPPNATDMSGAAYNSNKLAKERERLTELLKERLEAHDNNKKAVQDKLTETCEGLGAQICELGDKINKELEEKFTPEDKRLQEALNELRGNNSPSALQKAKAELLVMQSYKIIKCEFERYDSSSSDDSSNSDDDDGGGGGYGGNDDKKLGVDIKSLYELETEKEYFPEWVEVKKPTNVCVTDVKDGNVCVKFTWLNENEKRILSGLDHENGVSYRSVLFKRDDERNYVSGPLCKACGCHTFTPYILEPGTTYGIKMKMIINGKESEWSDIAEFIVQEPESYCLGWKEYPKDCIEEGKYILGEENPKIATKIECNYNCTVIGNRYLPANKVTSWSVKILRSKNNDSRHINVGVAPNDINQNVRNYNNCGWYFYCYYSVLSSGPPHNYKDDKICGPRKGYGQYVHTGDSVGVVMDTTKGELSFVLNGADLGVAYERIPLDKPLVPCVLLYWQGDSVELI